MDMEAFAIREAKVTDLEQILALLARSSLPTAGVKDHLQHFLVAEDAAGKTVGVIGYEYYGGDTALLRSAAVERSLRNSGIGSALVDRLLENSLFLGADRILLLTTTAEEYFRRKGFRAISRASVTGPVTRSLEFTGACPATAVCMQLSLTPRVLILCTGNSCRSQMAEALLKNMVPGLAVFSAGTDPAREVHPNAVAVMKEIGIDISRARPKAVERFIGASFDYLITVCDNAREACPVFRGSIGKKLHRGFEDPAVAVGTPEEVLGTYRRIRDEIRSAFMQFAHQESLVPIQGWH